MAGVSNVKQFKTDSVMRFFAYREMHNLMRKHEQKQAFAFQRLTNGAIITAEQIFWLPGERRE